MLEKKHRLSLAQNLKFSKKIKSGQLVLSIGEPCDENLKFAVVVLRKFCQKAVARNRTRRLIWDELAKLKDNVLPGIYKILVKADLSQSSYRQIQKELETIFEKGGCFKWSKKI